MEALESTKIELKSVNDELTRSNMELLKTKKVYSDKFDTILARAQDISNEKEKLEIELKDCKRHIDEQIVQIDTLNKDNLKNNRMIENIKITQIRSKGKMDNLEVKITMKKTILP